MRKREGERERGGEKEKIERGEREVKDIVCKVLSYMYLIQAIPY